MIPLYWQILHFPYTHYMLVDFGNKEASGCTTLQSSLDRRQFDTSTSDQLYPFQCTFNDSPAGIHHQDMDTEYCSPRRFTIGLPWLKPIFLTIRKSTLRHFTPCLFRPMKYPILGFHANRLASGRSRRDREQPARNCYGAVQVSFRTQSAR